MKRILKYVLLYSLCVYFSSNVIASQIHSSLLSNEIKGYMPYVDEEKGNRFKFYFEGLHERDGVIYLSQLSTVSIYKEDFVIKDEDGDKIDYKFKVDWYYMLPKPGFAFSEANNPEGLPLADSWDDFNTCQLSNDEKYYGTPNYTSIFEADENNPALLEVDLNLPPRCYDVFDRHPYGEDPVWYPTTDGVSIGAIFTPVTKTGTPLEGRPLKIWNHWLEFYSLKPDSPGDCNDEINSNKEFCQNEGVAGDFHENFTIFNNFSSKNKASGGGVEILNALAIYDNSNDRPLNSRSNVYVNHEYYTLINVLDNGVNREPSKAELETLKWHIIDKNNNIVATYDSNSPRLKNGKPRVNLNSGQYNKDGYVKYLFSTQVENDDADDILNKIGSSFSEQGYRLKISYGDNY